MASDLPLLQGPACFVRGVYEAVLLSYRIDLKDMLVCAIPILIYM